MTQHDHAFLAGRRSSTSFDHSATTPRAVPAAPGGARGDRPRAAAGLLSASPRPTPPRPAPPRPTPPRPSAPWPGAARSDREPTAPRTVDEALDVLARSRFTTSRAPGDAQVPFTLLYTYGWPCHVDAVHLRAEDDATAMRLRSGGASSPLFDEGDLVWRCEGTFLTVVGELLRLPMPGHRGAPERTVRVPSGLWIPGQAASPVAEAAPVADHRFACAL
ncbi:hypothetical protein [Actinoalloteichus hymeniacidonis]|uniref:Uncharacterized protein n=1 Tax=Actinoalloteichus hymeniacidonis TaxID=340345 RepID=A0AAC9HUV4_9PSEU|nr:hypothetical protein [Actinoalloteichus hymeniacidonis]AOS65391.1 hypothetical protein TL08_23055 [Actinoalloteichus hymeniacidonis]MBB5906523.1 hypothetical protein [Actinoalloteichus hymeniacidonis]